MNQSMAAKCIQCSGHVESIVRVVPGSYTSYGVTLHPVQPSIPFF